MSARSPLVLLLSVLMGACATTPFVYHPSGTGIPYGKGITIQIGKIQNDLGFHDPKAIRFNVMLDRPVEDAVREALTAELKEAGFTIGSSDLTLSVVIEAEYADEGLFHTTLWSFELARTGEALFSKKYTQRGEGVGSIWDTRGQVEIIRKALMQFIKDPEMQVALRPPAPQERVVAQPALEPAKTVKPPAGPVVDVDEAPETATKRRGNAHAVVIGIEQYRQKLPQADFAAHDAEVVAEYATKTLGYADENVVVLLNDRAAKSDLEKYLETWLPNRVEPNDTVLIYFSGHGAPHGKTGKAYLVPYDGDPAFLEKTGYPLDRLYGQLAKLPAKEVVVLLDSCFSGAGGRSVIAKGMRPMGLSVDTAMLVSGKTMVLAASSGEQVSTTYEQKRHGLLTYYFLKGLRGEADRNQDGAIELRELFEYVRPQVERVARREFNNEQTPQLLGAADAAKAKVFLLERPH